MALASGSYLDPVALRCSLAPYADRLLLTAPPAGAELVPAAAFTNAEQIRCYVERYAAGLGAEDLRAAASVWNKQYNAAVLMGTLTAMTLGGIGLDARLQNASIQLQDSIPRAMLLHDLTGSVIGGGQRADLYRVICGGAFAGHLAPVIDALYQAFGISRRILWGNVGNLVADMFDKWAAMPEVPAAVLEDRLFLLEKADSPLLPGKRNPLCGCVRYEELGEPDLPAIVRVRHTCCQKNRLPGGKACSTCPLVTREERVAILRELKA